MREICVFLSPSLHATNTPLVEGLTKNRIAVSCLDVTKGDDYKKAIDDHFARLGSHAVKRQPLLCMAFEDSLSGIQAARNARMCAIGIAGNRIEFERLRSAGAHAVALSMSDFLEEYSVRNYYQLVYLPYILNLQPLAAKKVGYPISLLDTLSGRIHKKKKNGTCDGEGANDICEDLVELDCHAQRIIPRDILGVVPGSLADVYINNVGWPQDNITTFRLDTHEIERDIIRIMARFYGYPDSLLRGYVTSGGTEGNFTGLWWNRDYLKTQSGGQAPVLFTSTETHYSITKAAQQLALEARNVATTADGALDCNDLSLLLDEIALSEPNRPVLLNANAGTTQTGAIDDLPKIHQLLMEKVKARGQWFAIHMDAALLGAVLPIVKPFGEVDYFRGLGVNTIAISGHKFFGSICVCGLCLTTAPFLDACFAKRETGVGYINGLHDQTPSGSRSGFSTLSLHNTLCGLYLHTNASRLRIIVEQCYLNAEYFCKQMAELVGAERVIRPPHSLNICFPRPSDELMDQYMLMPVSLPSHQREELASVCVLLNMDRRLINRFLSEYSRDINSHDWVKVNDNKVHVD